MGADPCKGLSVVRRQTGMTLVEVLAMAVVVGLVVTATVTGTIPWVQDQAARSAVYEVQSHLQIARGQAARSQRFARLLIEPATNTIRVMDVGDLADVSDDRELAAVTLSSKITIARPDAVAPVTLPDLGGGVHAATFQSDGAAYGGFGEIGIASGDRYFRVRLFAAGGTRVERWTDGGWSSGS